MNRQVGVFGLEEFGQSVAIALAQNGCEVMAVDIVEDRVQDVADYVTMAVRADVCDEDAMHSLGISNLDMVVIAISNDLEASIMATILAKEAGVPYVLVKAKTNLHATVLKKVGADQVVFPERAMGMRIARSLVSGTFTDIIELSSKFSMVEAVTPHAWIGKTLRQLDLRKQGLNVIAKKEGEEVILNLDPDHPLGEDEVYIIVGDNPSLEKIK